MSRKVFLFFDTFVKLQVFQWNECAEGPALARRTSSAYERSGLVPPKGRSLRGKTSVRASFRGAFSARASSMPSHEAETNYNGKQYIKELDNAFLHKQKR